MTMGVRATVYAMMDAAARSDWREVTGTAHKLRCMAPPSEIKNSVDRWLQLHGDAHPHLREFIAAQDRAVEDDRRRDEECHRDPPRNRSLGGYFLQQAVANRKWWQHV